MWIEAEAVACKKLPSFLEESCADLRSSCHWPESLSAPSAAAEVWSLRVRPDRLRSRLDSSRPTRTFAPPTDPVFSPNMLTPINLESSGNGSMNQQTGTSSLPQRASEVSRDRDIETGGPNYSCSTGKSFFNLRPGTWHVAVGGSVAPSVCDVGILASAAAKRFRCGTSSASGKSGGLRRVTATLPRPTSFGSKRPRPAAAGQTRRLSTEAIVAARPRSRHCLAVGWWLRRAARCSSSPWCRRRAGRTVIVRRAGRLVLVLTSQGWVKTFPSGIGSPRCVPGRPLPG
jgi:hypothetical protein